MNEIIPEIVKEIAAEGLVMEMPVNSINPWELIVVR